MHVARCCFTATKSINLRFSHHHSCHSTCQPDNMVGSDDRDGMFWIGLLGKTSDGFGWVGLRWVWPSMEMLIGADSARLGEWVMGCNHTVVHDLYLCICVFVCLCIWVSGWWDAEGWFAITHGGRAGPGGTRAAPAWRKSRVLCPHHPSDPASDWHLALHPQQLLIISWAGAQTAYGQNKPLNIAVSSNLWTLLCLQKVHVCYFVQAVEKLLSLVTPCCTIQ